MKSSHELLTDARLKALEAAVDELDAGVTYLNACLAHHGLSLPKPDTQAPGRWEKALRELETGHPGGAWGKASGGIEASRRDVDINLRRVSDKWFNVLEEVATEARVHYAELAVPVQVLKAIADRESNQGHSLDANGEGDRGQAFGVMQVDGRYHTQRGRPDPYSYEHALQATEVLMVMLEDVIRKHPDWPDKYLLKGAVVAYNSGVGNVQSIERMDVGTTGNDYGADVMARAQYYVELDQ